MISTIFLFPIFITLDSEKREEFVDTVIYTETRRKFHPSLVQFIFDTLLP